MTVKISAEGRITEGVEEFARFYSGADPCYIDLRGNFFKCFEVLK